MSSPGVALGLERAELFEMKATWEGRDLLNLSVANHLIGGYGP